jgi:hypothetical protein
MPDAGLQTLRVVESSNGVTSGFWATAIRKPRDWFSDAYPLLLVTARAVSGSTKPSRPTTSGPWYWLRKAAIQ